LMDRPEMGFFNGITTTTRRRLHQEEERGQGEMMAPKVISSVVPLLLNELPGYLSFRYRKLMGPCPRRLST